MSEPLYLHAAAINVDGYFWGVSGMHQNYQSALYSFADPPGILCLTEAPSVPQGWKLVDRTSNFYNRPYTAYKPKKVGTNDHLVVLWDTNRFEHADIQPFTYSQRFQPVALRSKEGDVITLVIGLHKEKKNKNQFQTINAIFRCIENYERDVGMNNFVILGDANSTTTQLQTENMHDGRFNFAFEDGETTTRNGTQCDHVIWDRDFNFDSGYIHRDTSSNFSHFPIDSYASVDY